MNIIKLDDHLYNLLKKQSKNIEAMALFTCILWGIWKAHNKLVFLIKASPTLSPLFTRSGNYGSKYSTPLDQVITPSLRQQTFCATKIPKEDVIDRWNLVLKMVNERENGYFRAANNFNNNTILVYRNNGETL